MNLIEVINEISEKAKNQLKPDLIKFGKNYRAISESSILETLNPLFKEHGIAPIGHIVKQDLRIEKINVGSDSSGTIIQQLVFVATVEVNVIICKENEQVYFSGIGMGIDNGDKAIGKAYTAAVKYAYLKGFRLQYSDDPDAEASKEITTLDDSSKTVPSDKKEVAKKTEKEPSAVPATEAQLSYIKGLTVRLGITDEEFKKLTKHEIYDKDLTAAQARKIIDQLKKKEEEDLPF